MMHYEFVLGKFPGKPDMALNQLQRYHDAQDELGIFDAAAVVKTEDGHEEFELLGGKKKAKKIGALTGAVVGLLGGPATVIALGLGGAAAGSLLDNLSHAGISKKMIQAAEEGLAPGSSAVIVIVEYDHRHLLLNDLKNLAAEIQNETVAAEEIEGKYLRSPSSGISET